MDKKYPRATLGNIPWENQAEAALSMEHEWPELDDFVDLYHLARLYNFDYHTLEVAARALMARNILEVEERPVQRKMFFLIPYTDMTKFYRRRL